MSSPYDADEEVLALTLPDDEELPVDGVVRTQA
jgi:hypothetical protein